jgi:hypothetical protein
LVLGPSVQAPRIREVTTTTTSISLLLSKWWFDSLHLTALGVKSLR